MLAELDAIVAAIPAEELAIQWDTAIEFAILEGVFPHALKDPRRISWRAWCGSATTCPAKVELGFHLCYGDSGGRHFKEPEDTSKLVAVANGSTAAVSPPRSRTGCTCRSRRNARTRPTIGRSRTCDSTPAPSFFWVSFTPTTGAEGHASPYRRRAQSRAAVRGRDGMRLWPAKAGCAGRAHAGPPRGKSAGQRLSATRRRPSSQHTHAIWAVISPVVLPVALPVAGYTTNFLGQKLSPSNFWRSAPQ